MQAMAQRSISRAVKKTSTMGRKSLLVTHSALTKSSKEYKPSTLTSTLQAQAQARTILQAKINGDSRQIKELIKHWF